MSQSACRNGSSGGSDSGGSGAAAAAAGSKATTAKMVRRLSGQGGVMVLASQPAASCPQNRLVCIFLCNLASPRLSPAPLRLPPCQQQQQQHSPASTHIHTYIHTQQQQRHASIKTPTHSPRLSPAPLRSPQSVPAQRAAGTSGR